MLASIYTCPLPMTTPRIRIFSILKLYFDCLKQRLCFSAIFRKQIVLSSSSFIVFASIFSCNSSQNILFIIHWNVPGKLQSPKYITWGLNSPLFVKNTAFHSSPSFIHTLLYSQIKSNLLKYLASFSLSITSQINSNGVLSLIVTWFNFW